MITLHQLRLLFDFGLVVLIWMVQLIVYPSFIYYSKADLIPWHNIYTGKITLIVLPLMLGQLIVAGLQMSQNLNWYTGISLLIILILWGSTFLVFVPLHGDISSHTFDEQTLTQLVNRNWVRTILWSLLFGLTAFWGRR